MKILKIKIQIETGTIKEFVKNMFFLYQTLYSYWKSPKYKNELSINYMWKLIDWILIFLLILNNFIRVFDKWIVNDQGNNAIYKKPE